MSIPVSGGKGSRSSNKGAIATMIGNAVPPKLAEAIGGKGCDGDGCVIVEVAGPKPKETESGTVGHRDQVAFEEPLFGQE